MFLCFCTIYLNHFKSAALLFCYDVCVCYILFENMMIYDHRLVEGSPLQYYVAPLLLVPPAFPYFKKFEVHSTPDMNEEMLPASPNSSQVIVNQLSA